MTKTLLLCFIHGFKGDDNTFSTFPDHLASLLSHALPTVTVTAVKYPAFETRGDLKGCAARVVDWLQNKVIDLEVANETPSPTVDPSVCTILVGHSMGGILSAEAILSIASEQSVSGHDKQDDAGDPSTFMFPYIQGLLAFDTPFFGIAPGVVAYGAESHLSTVTTAYSAYNSVVDAFGFGSTSKPSSNTATTSTNRQLLTAPPIIQQGPDVNIGSVKGTSDTSTATGTTSAGSESGGFAWQKWGRLAALAGGTGALAAAAGAAAYWHRDTISAGWSWASSHLEFVGCLARGEELRRRVSDLAGLVEGRGLGFADFYTELGSAATATSASDAGMSGRRSNGKDGNTRNRRTFVMLPSQASASSEVVASERFFVPAVNDKATDETGAHMSMFVPKENPGYYEMAERAKGFVVEWVERTEWYREAGAAGVAEPTAGVASDVDFDMKDEI